MKLADAKQVSLTVLVDEGLGRRRLATKAEIEEYIAKYFDSTVIDIPEAKEWDFTIPSPIGDFILTTVPERHIKYVL
jgi:hypothetical protein